MRQTGSHEEKKTVAFSKTIEKKKHVECSDVEKTILFENYRHWNGFGSILRRKVFGV